MPSPNDQVVHGCLRRLLVRVSRPTPRPRSHHLGPRSAANSSRWASTRSGGRPINPSSLSYKLRWQNHYHPYRLRLIILIGMFSSTYFYTMAKQRYYLSVLPPERPARGSEEDLDLLRQTRRELDALDVVTARANGKDGWVELDDERLGSGMVPSQSVADGRQLVRDTLAGTQLMGPSRTFFKKETGELVAIIWLGRDLSGWPGMVHGGASGTLLAEVSKWVAFLTGGLPSTAPVSTASPVPPLDSLSISYRHPTNADEFYVLRARPIAKPQDTIATTSTVQTQAPVPIKDASADIHEGSNTVADDASVTPVASRERTHYIHNPDSILEIAASLETLEGQTCVLATGVWTKPGALEQNSAGSGAWRGWLRWWSKKQ